VTDEHLGNIYQVDASSGATAQLLPFGAAPHPVAVAYDETAKLIYWTDAIDHTINRYSLLTNSSTVLYRDPSNTGKDTPNFGQVRWVFIFSIHVGLFIMFCVL